jgi:hypothetical protein
VARAKLTLVGVYEQRTIDDGPPFDRQFLEARSPSIPPRPVADAGSPCAGTTFQLAVCKKQNERQQNDANKAIKFWQDQAVVALEHWKGRAVATLRRLSTGKTEEATNGHWDLPAALLQTDHILRVVAPKRQCVVLLGGLAVRPPNNVQSELLHGATLIVPGWQGTRHVQDEWRRTLRSARIEFLPQAVTDLRLVGSVKTCLA